MENIKVGETFKLAGLEWKVLEITEQGCKCLAESIGDKTFSGDTNNWSESNLRKYLNGEFLKKLSDEIGEENIIQFERNLLSLDGQTEYGTCQDKVSLLDVDEYRKYRKYIPNSGDWFWLLTPWSTSCNGYDYAVAVVSPAGDVFRNFCLNDCGVRPFCIFSPAIFESEKK